MTAPPAKPAAMYREPDWDAEHRLVDGGEPEALAGSDGSSGLSGYTSDTRQGTGPAGSDGSSGLSGLMWTVLGDVRDHLARYVLPLSDMDLDVLTLWCAHTHLLGTTYTTPRLCLTSPLPESGKTTVLEHFQRLCHHPLAMASAGSPALFSRMLAVGVRTLMIDEADRNLRPDREGVEDVLAILNTGYKRGGCRPVLERNKDTWEVVEHPTFAPLVMAGIAPDLPDDTMSRTIVITMLPDTAGVIAESDWELIDEHTVALGERLAVTAAQCFDLVRAADPELPAECVGRMREKWRPLARIAAAAGDDWLARCVALIVRDITERQHQREEGLVRELPEIALLRDLMDEWPPGVELWPTEAMRQALVTRHSERWGVSDRFPKGLTVQRLGRYLSRTFRIHTVRQSIGDQRVRGYLYDDVHAVAVRLGAGS